MIETRRLGRMFKGPILADTVRRTRTGTGASRRSSPALTILLRSMSKSQIASPGPEVARLSRLCRPWLSMTDHLQATSPDLIGPCKRPVLLIGVSCSSSNHRSPLLPLTSHSCPSLRRSIGDDCSIFRALQRTPTSGMFPCQNS